MNKLSISFNLNIWFYNVIFVPFIIVNFVSVRVFTLIIPIPTPFIHSDPKKRILIHFKVSFRHPNSPTYKIRVSPNPTHMRKNGCTRGLSKLFLTTPITTITTRTTTTTTTTTAYHSPSYISLCKSPKKVGYYVNFTRTF